MKSVGRDGDSLLLGKSDEYGGEDACERTEQEGSEGEESCHSDEEWDEQDGKRDKHVYGGEGSTWSKGRMRGWRRVRVRKTFGA